MSDDREFWDDQQSDEFASGDDLPGADVNAEDAFPLLSADDFDEELEALAEYAGDTPDDADADALADDDVEDDADDGASALSGEPEDDEDSFDESAVDDFDESEDFADEAVIAAAAMVDEEFTEADLADEYAAEGDDDVAVSAVDDEDRLRQPRAGRFRRTVRNQLAMLPLALLLIALGGFLLAREQDVSGLPDLDDNALAVISVVTVGFAAVFHSLLSGRRERGLLFAGFWILSTVGLIAGLIYGIDDDPDVGKWWPLLLWSTALALMLTYLVERAHDVRLIFLGIVSFVAGVAAYAVSGELIDEGVIQDIADYWPLLLTILGIGLLPLVFQRRAE